MSHELESTNGRVNFAFTGDRKDIWHSLGQEMAPGMSIDQWAEASGLNFHVAKVPAFADLSTVLKNWEGTLGGCMEVPDRFFLARTDTAHIFPTCVSGIYAPVQPRDVLEWFDHYITVDDRFTIECAGALRQGDTIWCSARFNGDITVAGDRHVARLLMSTTFDCSGATINKPVMTRVVCNNTLNAALGEAQSCVKTRHNTKFNPKAVADELGRVASGFGKFKAIGDALAQATMARDEVSAYFKQVLDIPLEAKKDDISTRKLNMFGDLSRAWNATVTETNGGENATCSAWLALNAVTRYVDHDRTARGADAYSQGEAGARFASAQFGSGAALKAKAWGLLMPRIDDKVAVAA